MTRTYLDSILLTKCEASNEISDRLFTDSVYYTMNTLKNTLNRNTNMLIRSWFLIFQNDSDNISDFILII